MDDLEALLGLQEVDTMIDQLEYRRANLPERAELARLEQETRVLDDAVAGVGERHDGLSRSQRQLEDEIAAIEARVDERNRTLYAGTVNVPRELQAIQDEMAALGRHQRQLEDRVLDLMEELEPVDAELNGLTEQRDAAIADAKRVTIVLAETEAHVVAELESVADRRSSLAANIPPSLLSEYESLRARLEGVAVARLTGNRCEGCHLALPAVEVDQIRHEPPSTRVYCSECGRLLVP